MVFVCALLVGLVMLPIAGMAVKPNVTQAIPPPMNGSELIRSADAQAPNLAKLFGKVHHSLMMATEEAFGYILTGNISEKEAFYDEVARSEEAITAFQDAVSGARDDEQAIVTGSEEVIAAYTNMWTAADVMFTSYETEGKPVLDDVMAFETSVDAVFDVADRIWFEYNQGNPAMADASFRALYGRLLSAVQESYAYPVLGEVIEKEDALADFADFDARVARYEMIFPDVSFDAVKSLKTELQAAAEKMFTSYEADGVVKADDVAAFEAVIEKMNKEALMLFNSSSDIEENVQPEDNVENTTA